LPGKRKNAVVVEKRPVKEARTNGMSKGGTRQKKLKRKVAKKKI